MPRSLTLSVRVLALAAVLTCGGFALGYRPADVLAQQQPEVKCYLMVCTGTICVARQIECPPEVRPST